MNDEQINKAKKIVIGLLATVVALMVLHRVSAANRDLAWFNEQLSHFGAVLTSDIHVPYWVMIVLLACCAPFWIGVIRRLRPEGLAGDEPAADDYKEDTFLGVTWHWDYNPSTGDIEDLRCICPRCFEPATYRENSFTPLGPVTVAQCRTCGDIRDLKGTRKQALATVRNQIQDKLRRGMFRDVVRRQRAKAGSRKTAPPPRDEAKPDAPRKSPGKNPFGAPPEIKEGGDADGGADV